MVTLEAKYVSLQIGNSTCDVTKDPFNAKGDGTHNDTAAIASALSTCGGSDGGTIIIPKGARI